MGHICAAQQGIPPEQRESKLKSFDVYEDVRLLYDVSVAALSLVPIVSQ